MGKFNLTALLFKVTLRSHRSPTWILNRNKVAVPHLFHKFYFSTETQTANSSTVALRGIDNCNKSINLSFSCQTPSFPIPLPIENHEQINHFYMCPLTYTIENLIKEVKSQHKLEIITVEFLTQDKEKIDTDKNLRYLANLPLFILNINGILYECKMKISDKSIHQFDFDGIKMQIATLYEALDIGKFKMDRENDLLNKIKFIEEELKPMTEMKRQIEVECEKSVQRLLWLGFTVICIQMGVYARLTWWEYSWDIVEPVTYFSTFSTILITFAYYIITKQNFEYTSAHDRNMTWCFHRRATKYKFDIKKYNELCKMNDEHKINLLRVQTPDNLYDLEVK